MASLAVMLIILGCGALMYFKGTVVKAFAMIIIAIVSSVVAFGFFEILANVIISRGNDGSLLSLVPYAQTLSFLLLFIVTFGLLQTAATFLGRHPVDLGFMPELIGRIVCGIILGFIISGLLLTALQMAPLPTSYPYERFNPSKPDLENPGGALLNADGFVTGLFGIISNGSFSGKNSFKAIHPNYLDQLFMGRLIGETSNISGISPAIEVPKPGIWPISENVIEDYVNSGGKLLIPVPKNQNYTPTIVRVGIKKKAIKGEPKINGGVFTPSQLRLICTRSAGEVVNVYPVGYMKTQNEMEASKEIKIATTDIQDNAKYIDFVFCIPSGYEPTLVEFKLNSIVEIPAGAIVSADQAPAVSPFKSSASAPQSNTQRPPRTQSQPPQQQQQQARPGRSGPSNISRSIIDDELDQ